MFFDQEEIEFLKDIHKLIAKQIPVEEGHPYPMSIQNLTTKMVEGAKPAAKGRGGAQKRGRGFGSKDKPKSAYGNMSGRPGGGQREAKRS